MLPPQLRSPGRTNITTKQGEFRKAVKDFFTPKTQNFNESEFKTSDFDYFKKGGRVTKKVGAAKRGFGKAYKGGK